MGMFDDKYDRKVFGGPQTMVNPQSSSNNQWFGTVNVTCGIPGAVQDIRTTLVGSASFIDFSLRAMSPASGACPTPVVTSMVAGVGFTIGLVSSVGLPTSFQVWWQLYNPAGP